jgi:hypothetical protein
MPITPISPVTCFVEFDRVNHGRKSIALCGEWVAERDISGTPTCPECRRLLGRSADQVFGATAPGAPVRSSHRDDALADYHPRSPKPKIRN